MQRIENCKAEAIRPVLAANLSPRNAGQIVTDSAVVYTRLLPAEKHTEVSHKDELREFGELSTKTIEGAFSLFKRGVIGSYHHLSQDHLGQLPARVLLALQSPGIAAEHVRDADARNW